MAENSTIEWTDHTFNPWIGCQNVSPGCDNCYAEAMMDKRYGRVKWGPHGERVRTSEANWLKPLRWARHAQHFRELHGRRQRVFSASLSDWLDNQVPNSWRSDLANLIEATPQLDWLLLTKRIENFGKLAPWRADNVPSNVWVGITAENQDCYDHRWPYLDAIAAHVRFVSYEPAIGPLQIGRTRPSWLICGGESGPNARMMDLQWACDIKAECKAAGVPFFLKQMTGKKPITADLMCREFPTEAC